MNAIDAQIGKRLRHVRDARQVSLITLATQLNVKPVELADYENARVRVPAALIFLLCRELGVDYTEIFATVEL
jgi:transcriptional regulator with XRE-family HTH domain